MTDGRTMRAVLLTRHGGPEVLELRDVPVPEPGPGQVLVRVTAAGLNNTDVWTREGAYGRPGPPSGWLGPMDLPRIQGGDVAGAVVGLGPDADPGLLGARVLVDPAEYDSAAPDAHPVDILGSERDGGYAEYCVVPAARAHRVDDSPLTDVELACPPIAYGTALGMVERPVLDAVRTAAPGGLDVAVDVVAGPSLAAGVDLLRDGGRWVVAGALDGAEVTLDVRRLYLRNRVLLGSTMHTPAIFDLLVGIARRGEAHPVVAGTFPLEDAAEAQRTLETRAHVGKLVLVP